MDAADGALQKITVGFAKRTVNLPFIPHVISGSGKLNQKQALIFIYLLLFQKDTLAWPDPKPEKDPGAPSNA